MSTPLIKPKGWHSQRTFGAQTEAAKLAFLQKQYEGTAQRIRFMHRMGKSQDLFTVCDTLGIDRAGRENKLITHDELTALILQGRELLASKAKAVVSEQSRVEVKVAEPVVQKEETVISVPTTTAPAAESSDTEEEITIDLPELEANPKVIPFPFQIRKAKEIVRNLHIHKHRANLLLAGTGYGKTYMLGAAIAALKRLGYFDDSRAMWPVLYVTKASIVEQTKRVLEQCFGVDDMLCMVTNIEQLRANIGKVFVAEQTVVISGQEHTLFTWRPRNIPRLVIWDESQILKNVDSIQSRIAQALNDVNELTHGKEASKIVQIFSSATPFMRVCEAKCFCVATRAEMGTE
jgi:hypothetical protein